MQKPAQEAQIQATVLRELFPSPCNLLNTGESGEPDKEAAAYSKEAQKSDQHHRASPRSTSREAIQPFVNQEGADCPTWFASTSPSSQAR